MKYYDNGQPIYQSTEKKEKRDAQAVLKRAEGKVLDSQREGPMIQRTRFEDLVGLLKQEYALKGRKTWTRREYNLARLKPVFGGMRVKAITTDKLQGFITKRLDEGAAPAVSGVFVGTRLILRKGVSAFPQVRRKPRHPVSFTWRMIS